MSQDVSSSGNCLLETPESKPPDSDSGLDSEPSLETVTEQSVPTNELPEEITSTTGDPPVSVVPQESITLPEVIKEVSQLVKGTVQVPETTGKKLIHFHLKCEFLSRE